MSFEFDAKVAMEQFEKRLEANRGKQIQNSRLPAGSPMYYYCRYCGAHTQTLSECHTRAPITVCVPCEHLVAHGLITPIED